ncbi:MAG: VOC family protein [Sphingobium phenoxybenzoativorans]|uniref:VOC family protein n=1 Tax=Sphingobium phenoxybenzoativorans TaxID=1592790 RepID=UPI00087270CC|nr:VOC family protein [Sphingobium phenoxybenzoativorans]
MDRQLTTTGKVNGKFDIRGINHIALVSSDMQRTVDFYEGILGMPLIKTYEIGPNGRFGQHFFFDMGSSSLAFFWFPDAPASVPGVTSVSSLIGSVTAIGTMNHIALDVDADRLPEYKARLEAAGVEVSPIVHHNDVAPALGPDALEDVHESNWVSSIYFRDPDGIHVEFAGWTRLFTEADIACKAATAADADGWTAKRDAITA